MLERALITANSQHPQRWFTLPLTIAVHALALGGAVVAGAWDLTLPSDPPSQVRQYSAVAELPRVPPAAGSSRASSSPRRPAAANAASTAPRVAVPTEVPDATPRIDSLPSTGSAAGGGTAATAAAGDPGGVDGGEGIEPLPGAGIPSLPMRAGGEVRPPQILTQVKPLYPVLAIRSRTEGYVIIEAVIDRYGVVQSARVLRSSSTLFDEPALAALYKWRFKPGAFNGNAVDTIFTLTVNFRLE